MSKIRYILFGLMFLCSFVRTNAVPLINEQVREQVKEIPDLAENFLVFNQFDKSIDAINIFFHHFVPSNREDSILAYRAWSIAGQAYYGKKDMSMARYYLEAVKSFYILKHEYTPDFAKSLYVLASVYSDMQNIEQMKENLLLAKSVFEANKDWGYDYVTCILGLSNCSKNSGHLFDALMYADAAYRQVEKLQKDKVYQRSVKNQGSFKYLTTEEVNQVFNNLLFVCANDYLSLMTSFDFDYSQSSSVLENVLKTVYKKGDHFISLYSLGNYYKGRRDMELAATYYKSALKKFDKNYFASAAVGDVLYFEILKNLAITTWCQGLPECTKWAKDCFGIKSKEINSKFPFMTDYERKSFINCDDLLYWTNRIFIDNGSDSDYMYLYDSQLLRKGLLVRSSRDARNKILSTGTEEQKKNLEKVESIRKKILDEPDPQKVAILKSEAESIERDLMMELSEMSKDKVRSGVTDWSSVKESMKDDDIAIEFFYVSSLGMADSLKKSDFKSSYYALTLKKGYKFPHLIKIADEEQVKTIDKYETSGLYKQTLYDLNNENLYNLIWKPLEEEIGSAKNVYFSPDNELHNIAIEYSKNSDGVRFNDKYNVHRLSSTRVIAEKKKHTSSGNATLYGGLYYDLDTTTIRKESAKYPRTRGVGYEDNDSILTRAGIKLKYLGGTKKEVKGIYDIMQKSGKMMPTLYTDSTGNEESVRALSGKNVDVLYFATHGIFLSDNKKKYNMMSNIFDVSKVMTSSDRSMYSGLFMSGVSTILKNGKKDGIEDGYLMAKEIAGLDFSNVDLVTLSACETGLGENGGDGAFGLQRGFKLAGVNSIIMTLWEIDDVATGWFMNHFFEHLISGHSKAESLKYAQESVRKYNASWDDTFYWAGFILLDGLD